MCPLFYCDITSFFSKLHANYVFHVTTVVSYIYHTLTEKLLSWKAKQSIQIFDGKI